MQPFPRSCHSIVWVTRRRAGSPRRVGMVWREWGGSPERRTDDTRVEEEAAADRRLI